MSFFKKIIILNTLIVCGNTNANIFIDFQGGLGNRMFQYAVGYAVSQKQGVSLYAPNDSIEDIFNVEYKHAQPNHRPVFCFSEKGPSGYVEDNQKYKSDIFLVKKNTILSGFFQTDKYFIKYREDLIKMFTLKDIFLQKKAASFVKKINKLVVCMHVRTGDYFTYNYPVMDYDYFIKSIKLTLNLLNVELDKCAFVIISDDTEGKYVQSLIVKIKEEVDGIDIFEYQKDVDPENKFKSDFALMQISDVCVTSISSFSWWAAWLNTKCKAIISPKYWFNYYRYKDNLISEPLDIEMSLKNQHFILSEGFFHKI